MTTWQQITPADTGAVIALLHGTGPAKPPPPPLGTIRIPTARDVASALREARGDLPQDRLAVRSGISADTISLTETGRNRPLVVTLIELAHALGYDLALIPREDTP